MYREPHTMMHLCICTVLLNPKKCLSESITRIRQHLDVIEGISIRGVVIASNDDPGGILISSWHGKQTNNSILELT